MASFKCTRNTQLGPSVLSIPVGRPWTISVSHGGGLGAPFFIKKSYVGQSQYKKVNRMDGASRTPSNRFHSVGRSHTGPGRDLRGWDLMGSRCPRAD
jgi:hypothetical protein